MSELNSTNAWPFTEISAEEGLDINAIFGDSTDTANQGNPFEAPAAAAAGAPAPATQEMPAAPAVEAAAPMPAAAPPKEAPAPAQPESNAAAGNPIAAAFEQKTAENTKKGLLEKPPVFYHKGVKEDIEDASMTFEELRIRKSEDFTDLEEGKRVSWSVEYCGIRKEIKDPKGTTIISMKETIERSREFLEALKKSKEKDPCCYVKPKVEMKTKGNAAYKGRFGTLEEARESDIQCPDAKRLQGIDMKKGDKYAMDNSPARFLPGAVCATPAALEVLSRAHLLQLLERHLRGDWGDTCKNDRIANEHAICNGDRIVSWYQLSGKTRVLIITEADRSATTIMLSEEY